MVDPLMPPVVFDFKLGSLSSSSADRPSPFARGTWDDSSCLMHLLCLGCLPVVLSRIPTPLLGLVSKDIGESSPQSSSCSSCSDTVCFSPCCATVVPLCYNIYVIRALVFLVLSLSRRRSSFTICRFAYNLSLSRHSSRNRHIILDGLAARWIVLFSGIMIVFLRVHSDVFEESRLKAYLLTCLHLEIV